MYNKLGDYTMTENKDIYFKVGSVKFNYRVGAIIIDQNNLLMIKNSNYDYYYSPGGRVKENETSEEAVLREVVEETNINMKIEKLAYVHENFVYWEIGDEFFHEIAFFYLMKPIYT